MNFLNPPDALIPKILFSFFAEFWVRVTFGPRGSFMVGLGGGSIGPFGEGKGASKRTVSTPPPPRTQTKARLPSRQGVVGWISCSIPPWFTLCATAMGPSIGWYSSIRCPPPNPPNVQIHTPMSSAHTRRSDMQPMHMCRQVGLEEQTRAVFECRVPNSIPHKIRPAAATKHEVWITRATLSMVRRPWHRVSMVLCRPCGAPLCVIRPTTIHQNKFLALTAVTVLGLLPKLQASALLLQT